MANKASYSDYKRVIYLQIKIAIRSVIQILVVHITRITKLLIIQNSKENGVKPMSGQLLA